MIESDCLGGNVTALMAMRSRVIGDDYAAHLRVTTLPTALQVETLLLAVLILLSVDSVSRTSPSGCAGAALTSAAVTAQLISQRVFPPFRSGSRRSSPVAV